MGRYVTCGDEIVWKYVFGKQASELYRVPMKTGAGQHNFIKIDQEKVLEGGTIEWRPVDPAEEEFDAEFLKVTDADIPTLRRYVEEHMPKNSFFDKLLGRRKDPDDFTAMIDAIADYAEGKGEIELLGEI